MTPMRLSSAPALSLATLLALPALLSCAPVPEADAPLDEDERPCRTHDDCEIRATETGPRNQLCSNRAIAWNPTSAKDAAACGPMPNMTPKISEPQLLCFRGQCVPVGRDD